MHRCTGASLSPSAAGTPPRHHLQLLPAGSRNGSCGAPAAQSSAIVGAGFLSPESGRLRDLMKQKGLEDPEVQARVKRITMVVRIDFLLLVLIVADMVIKPGT